MLLSNQVAHDLNKCRRFYTAFFLKNKRFNDDTFFYFCVCYCFVCYNCYYESNRKKPYFYRFIDKTGNTAPATIFILCIPADAQVFSRSLFLYFASSIPAGKKALQFTTKKKKETALPNGVILNATQIGLYLFTSRMVTEHNA